MPEYRNALLNSYGEMIQPKRKGTRGRKPKPRLTAPEDLIYAHVVKKREKGRVVSVTRKEIFGSEKDVDKCLKNSGTSESVKQAL